MDPRLSRSLPGTSLTFFVEYFRPSKIANVWYIFVSIRPFGILEFGGLDTEVLESGRLDSGALDSG